MPEETKEAKAKKLAAARKKLKEYQRRGTEANTTAIPTSIDDLAGTSELEYHESPTVPVSSVSSTVLEKSGSELNCNGQSSSTTQCRSENKESTSDTCFSEQSIGNLPVLPPPVTATAAAYFTASAQTQSSLSEIITLHNESEPNESGDNSIAEVEPGGTNILDIVIKEKSKAIEEMNKYRLANMEKEAHLHELEKVLTSRTNSLDEYQKLHKAQEQNMLELRTKNQELEEALTKVKAINVDHQKHLDELKNELGKVSSKSMELEQKYQMKCNELEMAQIRIQQLSDEGSSTKDNRIETLNQTRLMHEQQIRDLQAMVQHLTQEKEQGNLQYQTYMQHLNAEVAKLNEKNSELTDECSKLQERERQLVDHISGLERDIQKSISRREEIRKQESSENTSELTKEIEKLKEKVTDFDFERHEFQLKIKSQEDRLETLNVTLVEKENEIDALKERLDQLMSEQPDTTKLLATMESDKVAASRALTQNVALKKQLDELELRFVQLTNDKADLVNKIDAEEYGNREMRINYAAMEAKLHESEERFKFKDEEMIRLSHENMELTQEISVLQQQLDRLQHKQVNGRYPSKIANDEASHENQEHKECDHNHDHDHEHGSSEHDDNDFHHDNSQNLNTIEIPQQTLHTDACQEAKESDAHELDHLNSNQTLATPKSTNQHHIATEEAVEKLQQRFTQLITQVADLTDERQRLEHLVMQLQSETETIGEYITLYQTQRRMLKQREYEKTAQMKLLQSEREQLHEKITLLNNLVSSLGVQLPSLTRPVYVTASGDGGSVATANIDPQQVEGQASIPSADLAANLTNSIQSKEILTKIQDILTDIRENTIEVPTVPHTVDHLNCCLGKFETV